MPNFIVAYGYQDKFVVPEKVAKALAAAKVKKAEGVWFEDRFYSTSFVWLMPQEETTRRLLTPKQMVEAGHIAHWLAMPIHELNMTENAAVEYASKVVARVDLRELRRLARSIGYEGAFPNPRKFMAEVKQLGGGDLDLPLDTGVQSGKLLSP